MPVFVEMFLLVLCKILFLKLLLFILCLLACILLLQTAADF